MKRLSVSNQPIKMKRTPKRKQFLSMTHTFSICITSTAHITPTGLISRALHMTITIWSLSTMVRIREFPIHHMFNMYSVCSLQRVLLYCTLFAYLIGRRNNSTASKSRYRKNIVTLFRRFYRYAIDIDNVCNFRQHLLSSFIQRGTKKTVYFMDLGFAPGGMSRLLLDSNVNICGLGITLSSDSANDFVQELTSDPRYLCRNVDVVELAQSVKDRDDFLKKCAWNGIHPVHGRFSTSHWNAMSNGFELVIMGCTCVQERNDDGTQQKSRVHHTQRIHLSELYLSLLMLSDGGSILVRHYNSSTLYSLHLLYVFLQCFKGYQAGKPLSDFAKNKSYWILWKGFDAEKAHK